MTTLEEYLDTALFPIERPDFFLNVEEYFDIIEKTVKKWLEAKKIEFAKRYNADGGSDAEYISYSSEMALFDELLKELQSNESHEKVKQP